MCFLKQEKNGACKLFSLQYVSTENERDVALTVCKLLFMAALNGILQYHQREIVICASSTIDFTLCDCFAPVHVLILSGSTTDP